MDVNIPSNMGLLVFMAENAVIFRESWKVLSIVSMFIHRNIFLYVFDNYFRRYKKSRGIMNFGGNPVVAKTTLFTQKNPKI